MKIKLQYISVVAALALLTGCNSNNSSISSSTSSISGTAIDGYISGGTVCADLNNNFVCDANEPSTTTNVDGTFTLEGDNIDNATLLLVGGTDMGTGLAFQGQLTAPAGSKTVTPLTTVITSLVSQGQTLEDAQNIVRDSLGISSDVDLKNYDPIEELTNDSTNERAKKVLTEQIKVQILIDTINNTVGGLLDDTNSTEHYSKTFKNIAKSLESKEDLTDSSIIKNLIHNSADDALSHLNENDKQLRVNRLNNVSTTIAQKGVEALNETVNQINQNGEANILHSAYAGLNITVSEISKLAKEASQNGDDSSILNLDVVNKIHNKLSENENFEKKLVDIKFTGIDVPLTIEDQSINLNTKLVSVNGEDQVIDFNVLRATGDSDNNEIFGLVKDYQDNPMTLTDGSPYICNGTNVGVGSGLDFSSILQKNGKLYMVNQFECSIGTMYMFELEQKEDGTLTPKKDTLKYISQKDEFGGFTHCAGMATPWQSHLSSEEYEPNAKIIETGKKNTYYDEVTKYWGGDANKNNPYYYGWIPEVKITEAGEPDYTKHYSMGRISHELAYVMPDRRTVYMTDDGTNVGLYMFVADKAEDLSSGTLYAAKFNQVDAYNGGNFSLEWLDLGHASDSEIRDEVSKQYNFSDIFDEVALNADNTCPSGYTAINTSAGAECLKIKDGMAKIASRLETRRYAAIKGATTELNKEEGLVFDPIHKKLYVAITEITKGMEDNKSYGVDNTDYDVAGYNHIKLPDNACGGVYALDLKEDANKNSDYIAQNFYAILTGEAKDYEGTKYAGNSCNIDKIANPDNLSYIPNTNNLIIGEDSGAHKNNMLWTYNVESGELTRIMSVPLGAEATSTDWYQDINGYSYQTLVTQHPSTNDKESYIGVLGPIKNLNKPVKLPEDANDIKVPDFKVPGIGDIEGELPDCYTSGDGLVFKSNFECKSLLPWSTYSTASNADWVVSSHGGSFFAYISGYKADEAANDWLISPKFILSGDEVLTFKSAKGYSGPDLQLLISDDYSGSEDPELATWTQLDVNWATTDNGNFQWTNSGDIDLSAYIGKTVYFAFRQVATGVDSGEVANWEIDNFIVSGSGEVSIPFTSDLSVSKTDSITTVSQLTFNPTISGGQAPFTYEWDFGTGDTSLDEKTVYTFKTAGDFEVTLTITDNTGAKTSSKISLRVATPLDEVVPAKIGDLRIATFNAYLNRPSFGKLKEDIDSGTDSQIKNVAEIIQRVNPDILLLQEFDYNGTEQVDTFIRKYLNVAQKDDTTAIDFPYYYTTTVNTGTQPQTPVDFNNDGITAGPDDAFGFGEFEGQYGMLVLSKYPIQTDKIRTFQKFLWKDMPNANIPKNIDGSDYYNSDELAIFRLSSKSHWDIPVSVNGTIVNVLTDHPTPPTFDDGDADGKDDTQTNNVIDWNGKRNHDEIRIWADYVSNKSDYLYDDNSVYGGLAANTRFVIMGDQNADNNEGDAYNHAIDQLLTNPNVNAIAPTSEGAVDEGLDADDTANWGLRADYVLPSDYGFKVNQSAVYWPRKNDVKHPLVEKTGSSENSSDHRLVWVDLSFVDGSASDKSIESLETSFDGSLGDWNTFSLTSNKDWGSSSFGGVTFAKINGYGGDEVSNDWLVSPKINFTGKQVLSFKSAKGYGGPDLKVKISTDFDGTNIDTATWTELNATFANADNGNYKWLASGDIDLSSYTGEGYIAFEYTSTGTGGGEAATWEVTNVKLAEPLPTTITQIFDGSLADWNAFDLASNKNWESSSFGGVTFAKINGFGGDIASNDWLISPKIDFTGDQTLSFDSAKGYSGPDLKVKISTDFDGTNIDTATWTELSATFANTDNGNYKWLNSGEIDLSSYTTQGYIAFEYTSTGTAGGEAATWEITNINVKKKLTSGLEEYYSSALDLTGIELKDTLHTITKTNQLFLTYSKAYVLLEELDADPNNSNNVLLLYTNRSQDKTATKCNVVNNADCWNREHTWPKSLGVGNDSSKNAYTDLIQLRASDSSVNSDRGNKIFGNVGNTGSENSEALGNYSNATTWEPRDEIKGDIARITFYMATRYEGIDSETDLEFNTIGDICTLLTWNAQDPISQEEKARNELVYKYQNNRNPFVDNDTYAQKIWGTECP